MKNALCGLLMVTLVASAPAPAPSPVPPPIVAPNFPVAATTRDGSKDWSFEYGTWRTHYRLLAKRLEHSHTWYDCYGTSVIIPFWNGEGNVEDGDLKCSNRYIGGMTLRMYNPQTHQWTLWWGTKQLAISPPAQIGHWESARLGNFYAYDTWHGTPIINRFRWTIVNGNPHFEQAFSTDGMKTWETNWTTDYYRVSASTPGVWNRHDATMAGHRNFDFLVGSWNLRTRRMHNPLSNNEVWSTCTALSKVHPFWSGAGDVQEAQLHCGDKSINTITVRLYDATQNKWFSYWATQPNGLGTGLPMVGTLDTRGHGELYGSDTLNGKPILERAQWSSYNGNPHFEQAFSPDNGKTWEPNWITYYTCANAKS